MNGMNFPCWSESRTTIHRKFCPCARAILTEIKPLVNMRDHLYLFVHLGIREIIPNFSQIRRGMQPNVIQQGDCILNVLFPRRVFRSSC